MRDKVIEVSFETSNLAMNLRYNIFLINELLMQTIGSI